MINFSLNICWRLIPTKSDKRRNSSVAFSYLFDSNQYVLMGRSVLGQMSPHPDIKRQVRLFTCRFFFNNITC